MNYHTAQFCNAASRYYGQRTPDDFSTVRALWARSRAFAELPSIVPPLPPGDTALATVSPGGTCVIPHASGLHLDIDGEIMPDFPVKDYVDAIRSAKGTITVRVNSGGGDLTAGFTLHDALLAADPARVEVLVTGACGSAATLVLAAADRRRVLEGSRVFVHQCSTCVWGTAAELRSAAIMLEKWIPRMAKAYERICAPDLVSAWLRSGDHFFGAQDAVSVGLATEAVESVEPVLPSATCCS